MVRWRGDQRWNKPSLRKTCVLKIVDEIGLHEPGESHYRSGLRYCNPAFTRQTSIPSSVRIRSNPCDNGFFPLGCQRYQFRARDELAAVCRHRTIRERCARTVGRIKSRWSRILPPHKQAWLWPGTPRPVATILETGLNMQNRERVDNWPAAGHLTSCCATIAIPLHSYRLRRLQRLKRVCQTQKLSRLRKLANSRKRLAPPKSGRFCWQLQHRQRPLGALCIKVSMGICL